MSLRGKQLDDLVRRWMARRDRSIFRRIRRLHRGYFRQMISRLPAAFIPGQELGELSDEVLVRFTSDRAIFGGETPFELLVARNYPAAYFLYFSGDSAGRKVLVRIGGLVSEQFTKSRNQYKHVTHVLRKYFRVMQRQGPMRWYGLEEWADPRPGMELTYDRMKKLALAVAEETGRHRQVECLLKLVGYPLLASQIAEIIKLTEGFPPRMVSILPGGEQDSGGWNEESVEDLPVASPRLPMRERELAEIVTTLVDGLDPVDAFVLSRRYGTPLGENQRKGPVAFERIAAELADRGVSLTGEALRVRERKILIKLRTVCEQFVPEEWETFVDLLLELARKRPLS
ncbi:hypothetical protein JW905_10415 [bacterium]|nr:hypothetical protein [candidate division CSSED10-310 bacterium]